MSDKYKLVKFKDGSTSVVARRVRLGKPIFHGTWDECLWHQDAVDHPDPETPILMPLETGAMMNAKIPFSVAIGDHLRPIINGFGNLQDDRWYEVNHLWEPNQSPLLHVGFENLKGSFPVYGTADLQPNFVRFGEEPRPLPTHRKKLGPVRNGEWVRPVTAGLFGLPDGWLTVHDIVTLPFSKARCVAVSQHPGVNPWLDAKGKPNFVRWFEEKGV